MSVFEKVTDVGLEILTDKEVGDIIEELKNERERRWNLRRIEAVDEILEVMNKHYDTLGDVWFSVNDNSDFCLDTLMIAFESYRKQL